MIIAGKTEIKTVNKVDPFNALRTIAALMVFFLHCTLFEDTSFMKSDLGFVFRTPAWGGVWIFFVMGGFLFGLAYARGRYSLDFVGTISFFKRRFFKTLLPTFVFIGVCLLFVFPDFLAANPTLIIKFLTLSYRGIPGADGIGACWYVFTIACLWGFTPLAGWIMSRINNAKSLFWQVLVFVVLVVMGFGVRNFVLIDAHWYCQVYTSAIVNVDLYFGGFIWAYIITNLGENRLNCGKWKKEIKAISWIALIFVITYNCYTYNQALAFGDSIDAYSYCYETIYLLLCCFFFWANFDSKAKYEKVKLISMKANPFRVVDVFSGITFEFYLFHSLILNRISQYIPFTNGTLAHHFFLVLEAFLLSVLCSIGYQRLFQNKRERKIECSSEKV